MCLLYNLLLYSIMTMITCRITPENTGVKLIDVDQGLKEYSDYDQGVDNLVNEEDELYRSIKEEEHDKSPIDISRISDMMQHIPLDGSFHIHTFITIDKTLKMRNKNNFYLCEKFNTINSNELCNATSYLLERLEQDNINSTGAGNNHSENSVRSAKSPIKISYTVEEDQKMLGHDIILNKEENEVNKMIMRLKNLQLTSQINKYGAMFNRHFFSFKDEIKNTDLFKIIKAMPKGAVLHVHDIGIMPPEYLLEITYRPFLNVCFQNGKPIFHFSEALPLTACESQWVTMEEARLSADSAKQFDTELIKKFTLVTNAPYKVYTNRYTIMNRSRNYFDLVQPLLSFKPIWENYMYNVFKAFRDENVMYIEIRSNLPELYDLDGNTFDSLHTAAMFKKVLEEFKSDFPDFFGAKLIYSPSKMETREEILENIEIAKKLKVILPDFFAGIDLADQNNKENHLKTFLRDFVINSDVLQYFYHIDELQRHIGNEDTLFEALFLQVKRIGHPFGIINHPVLLREIRKSNIALEVNVVSNMVSRALDDVRSHPLAQMIAKGMSVVLTSDLSGFWEGDPISHDFYVTFIGVSSSRADMKLLKKLAINSILYSEANNKGEMLQEFLIRWLKFIHTISDKFS